LHPEAQKKFIEYLLNKIKVNKHQIVVATHSVEFIKLLPPEAIKLIKLNEENQAVIEKQYCLQEEAFIDLGNNNYEKHKIYVEDDVAKLIVDSVLNKIVDINSDLFEVIVFPGGDSHIYGAIVATACVDNNRKCHVILDGDKDTGSVLLQPEQISQQMIARGELDNNIKDFVGSLS
ncbi:ATP-binding protein, partial [Acinetobacter pittii]|uniref:ATP-binding protein n=1 Tax=Acinetobacter pittii TaxID=48296 RepID=UPI001BDBAF8F